MKIVRFTSTILYAITRFLSVIYLITGIYALAVILLSPANADNSFIQVTAGTFRIYYPFTATPFLLGDYTPAYITEMLGLVLLYGLFFWLLNDVFSVFRQHKLFTPNAVTKLSRFYTASLVLPVSVLLLMAVFSLFETAAGLIAVLHLIIGIFTFFMAAIFREGLHLQNEQDFTI